MICKIAPKLVLDLNTAESNDMSIVIKQNWRATYQWQCGLSMTTQHSQLQILQPNTFTALRFCSSSNIIVWYIRAPTMVLFCGNGLKFGLLSQFGQNMVRISVIKSDFWDLSESNSRRSVIYRVGPKSIKSKLVIICHLRTQGPYLKAISHVMMCHSNSDQNSDPTIPVIANKINSSSVGNLEMKIISMLSW